MLAGPGLCVAAEPVWYPATEPSPFIPDDARIIGGGPGKLVYFRGQWPIRAEVKRAVLVAAPMQTVRLYLNGRLVLEAYDSHQARPAWAEVTDKLRPGVALAAAQVASEWRPCLYVQMRVEYADGSWQDLGTSADWQWCAAPAADWMISPQAAGDWQPVEDIGGYYRDERSFWQREFALLPRDMLRERLEAHNARLRALWEHDRRDPGLVIAEPPERPEWARQFRGFCRVDDRTGQLIDGSGRVRHLFFTIYSQKGSLSLPDLDLEQLERDLDLMAQADVHLYMRSTGWGWLLTKDGDWAPLSSQPKGARNHHFARGIDLLDYFVRRAWAHGRYIIFEGDFFWSAHPDVVPPPYRSRYHLYPELAEAQALAMRRIMNRYRRCTNVLGMMIGEEDIVLDHDLENPHQHALFADFLRRKYGSLDEFKRQTPWGYDYADLSGYRVGRWRAEHWPGAPEVDVLVPGYTAREGVFDHIRSWEDIPLPLWPGLLSPDDPRVKLGACTSHNQFTPEDPLWIDFYEMREDELLFGMLRRWAAVVRQGMPNQLLFYSNAQDFTASWHFLHLYRRADLPFDVIGVGCHDSGQNLSEIPAWATVRKAIKVISSYRPYVLAPGSPARGVASGEGEGGRPGQPEEILNYYRGALFDEIGGGAAWTQTYAWDHISGTTGGHEPHLTPLLEWMSAFMPAVQGVSFSLCRPVQVLIVRNTNLAHSNMSGLDYGNALAVAAALSQLNVEFDIVMDRDLVYRALGAPARYKIDLSPYRLVILPTVAIDLCDSAWAALDAWLAEAPQRGSRVLAVGWIGKRGPRLQPRSAFHPVLAKWLGCSDYSSTIPLRGPQEVTLMTAQGPQPLTLDFGQVPPVGVLTGGAAFMTAGGATVAARFRHGSNFVYAFGFPLGFAHEPLWGMAPDQNLRDALARVYEELSVAAGLDRPVLAPRNLRVYVADGGKMLLVRERAGLPTQADVALRLPSGIRYPGLAMRRGPDGYTRLHVRLAPWESRWWKAL